MTLITSDVLEPRRRYQGRKGIYPVIVDIDAYFNQLNCRPIMADELDLETPQGQERFNDLVYSRYDGDVFSNVPSCQCGHVRRGHRINEVCSKCGFECLPITEQTIEPIVWVKSPPDIPAFMNLTVYRLLRNRFIKDSFSVIDYLIDPSYRPPKLHCAAEEFITAKGWERGLTYFHNNFDDIMEELCNNRIFLTRPAGARTLAFVEKHRRLVFCKHLPFPSKIGFIVEDVAERTYADPRMSPAIDALLSLAKVGKVGRKTRQHIESCIARSMAKLVQFFEVTERDKLFDKKGIIRKLIYGESPHWSFRTVITAMFRPHDHESLEIPWGEAVLTFKLHLANKLLREGYTPNEILTLIHDNTMRTHHKLEQLFDELIAESPNGRGIPCAFTRFPSLKRGSTQRFYIDKIKRDPTLKSTSISVLCLAAPNADFDGDYMSGQLALDNYTARAFDRLAPCTGIMDLSRPFRVSNHGAIPAPVLSTINHRLEEGDDNSVEVN